MNLKQSCIKNNHSIKLFVSIVSIDHRDNSTPCFDFFNFIEETVVEKILKDLTTRKKIFS